MPTIIYLDIDDEITTAAARIRGSAEPRVAVVLPPGSRLATSRMNFRLLAREALEWNRVLSIVAPDPASRAIAASAGLPVHATVQEYEDAELGTASARGLAEGAGVPSGRRDSAAGPPVSERGIAAPPTTPGPATAQVPAIVPPGVTQAGVTQAGGPVASAPDGLTATIVTRTPPSEPRARSRAASLPVVGAARTGGGDRAIRWLAVGIIAILLVAIAAVGYIVLPSATVVLVQKSDPIGPAEFVIRADPAATSVDTTSGVVPATRLTHDFTASGEFPATGQRVVKTKAKGTVQFTNCDTGRGHTIPAGSVVATSDGIDFATASDLSLPAASIVPFACKPGEVAVTAVVPGTTGNVPAGAITVIPPGFNSIVIKVTNPNATTGGKQESFTRVQQKDIDAATAQLTQQLQGDFGTWAKAPDNLGGGATVFPSTGALSAAIPSVDPTTLINVEEPTFQFGLTATGSVVAVDTTVVEQVAAAQIKQKVPSGSTLVAGSIKTQAGAGQASGEIIDFRVTATARAIRTLDPNALRDQIKGKSVADARRLLSQYGTVTIDTWPGFVTSIPSIDARLQLTIRTTPAGSPGASSSPGDESAPPSAAPAGSGIPSGSSVPSDATAPTSSAP